MANGDLGERTRWLDWPLQRVALDPLVQWHAQMYVRLSVLLVASMGLLAVVEVFLRGPLDPRTLAIGGEALLCAVTLALTAATGRWRVAAAVVLGTMWLILTGLDRLDTTNDPVAVIGFAMWVVGAVSTLGHRAAAPAFVSALAGRVIGAHMLEVPLDNIALATHLATLAGMVVLAGISWSADRSRSQAMRLAMRQAEDAKALAEAQRRFLATMSHEIRTPMNGVLNLTHLLGQTPLDRDQDLLVGTLRRSGKSLMSILDDVLDFSRLESSTPGFEQLPIDLRALLREVCRLLGGIATEAGLSLRHNVDDSVPVRVSGDPIRIRQIVTNLVSNAIKFTPSGQVRVTASLSPSGVSIAVADTGVGISDEALTRIFQPFTQADASTTRRYGGTGLGLAISERLCRAMGGEISCTSELGVGTTFTVVLPLPAVALPTAGSPLPPAAAPRRLGMRVLVAEDHAVNQLVARRLLEQLGVEAIVVDDGYAAVSLMASGERFDLVLMDLYMPNLDGFAATRAIRSLPGEAAHTPIVAVSASALAEDQQRSREAGMNGHLPKPIDPPALRAVLDRWLPTDPVVAADARSG